MVVHGESLTGRIKYKEHRFYLRDKQITCDHGCVEIDFKHGRWPCQPLTSYNTLCRRYQIHTSTKHAQKSYPMEKYYDIKDEYLNILNELPELPSMPDIGEPDVILADGEQ